MARKAEIEPQAQTQDIGADNDTAPNVQHGKSRHPRRMARVTVAQQVTEVAAAEPAVSEATGSQEVPAPVTAPRPTSKIAHVVALLERGEGATLTELVEATGWQPHTTRAALTGLKKKGRIIVKDKRGEVTCYRIEASA